MNALESTEIGKVVPEMAESFCLLSRLGFFDDLHVVIQGMKTENGDAGLVMAERARVWGRRGGREVKTG